MAKFSQAGTLRYTVHENDIVFSGETWGQFGVAVPNKILKIFHLYDGVLI